MEQLLQILNIFLISWYVVSFTPLHSIMNIAIEATNKYKLFNFFLMLFHTIISCQKCTAAFVGYFMYFDITTALLASFISYLYESKINV